MPDTNEDTMTLRELMCMALNVIEQSRQMLEEVTTSKRADIVRNMGAIQMQINACQYTVDRLNVAVDNIEVLQKPSGN